MSLFIYLYPSCLHQLKVAYMWISLYFSYPVLWPSLDTKMSLRSSCSLFLSLYQTGFPMPFILYQFLNFLSLTVGSWKGSTCPFFFFFCWPISLEFFHCFKNHRGNCLVLNPVILPSSLGVTAQATNPQARNLLFLSRDATS